MCIRDSNNAGATIGITGGNDGAVELIDAINPTVINSGTIFSEDGRALSLDRTTGAVFINNAGGVLTAGRSTIRCVTNCANTTIINSGKIIATSIGASKAIFFDRSVGSIITNNAGGEIIGITGIVITLNDSDTFTNSGLIRALDDDGKLVLSDTAAVILFDGTNTTVLLKDEGIVVGTISNSGDNAGSKLQVQHGYGRSYMYLSLIHI